MDEIRNEIPADAPAPPEGCHWKLSTLLEVGDEIYAGLHDLGEGPERFFFRVDSLRETAKQIRARTIPTHPLLYGHQDRRFAKDVWLGVRDVS